MHKFIFLNVYCTYLYMYTKAFLLHFIKAWERISKKEGEMLEHKLNEMGALNMK